MRTILNFNEYPQKPSSFILKKVNDSSNQVEIAEVIYNTD